MDDATVPGWSFRYGSGGDPAHDASPWVWMRAPWELQARWSTRFSFDDPNFQWLYVRVGYIRGINRCDPPASINPDVRGDTYVVAGLAPYAAYRVLAVSTDGNYLRMRVRYWVGLMNHFSYFQPPQRVGAGTGSGALGGIDTSRGRWDVGDFDASVWSGDRVTPRGTFAEHWTSLIDHLELSIAWTDPGGVDRGEYKVLYSCDPTDNLRAGPFAKYATRTNGLPTSFCFSDGDALATQQMTSFLGISTWGEACVCLPIGDLGGDGGMSEPGSALDTGIVGAGVGYGASGSDSIVSRRRAAVALGFERVFGAQVRVGARIAFWSPDGGVTSEQPHSVERYMVVSSADLETVDELVGRIDALRNRTTGTPANRWLLREFDLSRLEAAADGAEAFAVPCEHG